MQNLHPYEMLEGFLFLPLPVEDFASLPEHIDALGNTLVKKDEFHVTLLNTKRLAAELSVAPEDVVEAFVDFVKDNDISFVRFIDDMRYVNDPERGRMSVVIRCEVGGLTELFGYLAQRFGQILPVQPAHVTLYTLANGLGIGINNDSEMETFPRVSLPEVTSRLI